MLAALLVSTPCDEPPGRNCTCCFSRAPRSGNSLECIRALLLLRRESAVLAPAASLTDCCVCESREPIQGATRGAESVEPSVIGGDAGVGGGSSLVAPQPGPPVGTSVTLMSWPLFSLLRLGVLTGMGAAVTPLVELLGRFFPNTRRRPPPYLVSILVVATGALVREFRFFDAKLFLAPAAAAEGAAAEGGPAPPSGGAPPALDIGETKDIADKMRNQICHSR